MCGINGIYGPLKGNDGRQRIAAMNNALAHRGPDAAGIFEQEQIVLGHRRLSIIDLSEVANQPMSDHSGRYTLVFNGEIYNFRELRKTLTAYPFKTDCDTEVLLAGLCRWGLDFVKECNGMFAFALWDGSENKLSLVRDRLGIKPLYYARTAGNILFSSEIRALLKSELIKGKLNRDSLGEYLRYQTVHGTNTILDGVFMLPAGAMLTAKEDDVSIRTYWNSTACTETGISELVYEDTTALIRKRLREAVKRRLVADVPMGAFLSGGIDSSALVALAANELSGPLKTFTVTFDEAAQNEAAFAKMVADKYATDHTEIKLSPDALLQNLSAAISAMDHPGGDGINTYVVSKAAREAGIKVVLSGLGGDELFAGYPIFKQVYSLRDKGWLMSFPKFARSFAGDMLQLAKPGISSAKTKQVITEDYLDMENVYQYSREVASRDINAKLSKYGLKGAGSVFELVREGVGYKRPGYALPLLSKVSYAELSTYLQSVLLRDSDQMAMAHALEVRVPFLDHELVSAVLSVKDSFKYPITPKKLLTDAMGTLLPKEIVNRPKMGFVFPWDIWMRTSLRDFCDTQIEGLAARDEFDGKALRARWNAFLKNDKKVPWSRIWYLCVLQAWLAENGID